ncbi:MAG TPA: SIS domain-containing protein [Bryobacteraceae bacterium]|nr:SIS domain-containing protein [Bryobacteraceae bacterium]
MSKMLEETRQQPTALARTLEEGLASVAELRSHFERNRPRFVILVARGTSDNAAQFGRYLIEITTRIPVSLAAPSVTTLYGGPLDLSEVLVAGISQSGESTDTNAVLEAARGRGALTVGITNEPSSRMAKIASHVLLARAGREESVAATKTYTCQLLALYLLAHALGGNVSIGTLRRIPEWVERVLELEDSIAEIAERYTFMSRAVTVGRGLNYSNALELGLKLMETCYVVAERFSAADLMHGPIAMVEHAFPVFVFAPAGVTWPSIAEVLDRVKDLKAETLVFTDPDNAAACAKPARLVKLPIRCGNADGPEDLYTPIPYIVPAQLFAAHLAWIKGFNPDRPRALNKITLTM